MSRRQGSSRAIPGVVTQSWFIGDMRSLFVSLAVAALLTTSSFVRAEQHAERDAFPASWQGHWVGPCVATTRAGKKTDFTMELRIEPVPESERWTWEIVYAAEQRQVRPYELVPVDGEPGRYVIDEKNSILIDAYFLNDVVHSRFWVSEAVIDVQYEKRGDRIAATLVTYGAKPVRVSGGEDRVPPVASYGLRAVQRAVMTRKEK